MGVTPPKMPPRMIYSDEGLCELCGRNDLVARATYYGESIILCQDCSNALNDQRAVYVTPPRGESAVRWPG